jgi:Fic family protein
MKPPFSLTPKILNLCTEITQSLGQYEGLNISKPEPKLRKSSRIQTIQASLAIEGNTLAIEQVTAILDGKKVIGSKREILEVQNAIKAYDLISTFKPAQAKSLLSAHGVLMAGLTGDAGRWRSANVGIFQGDKIAHAAPQAKRVPDLISQLFSFIKLEKETHPLIVSALFHYELEFIHPFSDGNGRMGRLWQTVLLSRFHPLFEFTPVESAVRERQADYYKSLGLSDREGSATPFIEFSLLTIQEALEDFRSLVRHKPLTVEERLDIAREKFGKEAFTRKDYLTVFLSLSTATGSRDLAFGTDQRFLKKMGDKALAKYRFNS